VAEKLSCPRILVTQGKRGSLGYDREEGFLEVPAFTARIVDRVGAGDAVFAVSALCAREKMPLELAGLVANAVGAEAVGIVANRSAIQRAELFDYLHALRDRHRE
jgi:sugar/nucleoside kinase (ribokinase family)